MLSWGAESWALCLCPGLCGDPALQPVPCQGALFSLVVSSIQLALCLSIHPSPGHPPQPLNWPPPGQSSAWFWEWHTLSMPPAPQGSGTHVGTRGKCRPCPWRQLNTRGGRCPCPLGQPTEEHPPSPAAPRPASWGWAMTSSPDLSIGVCWFRGPEASRLLPKAGSSQVRGAP